MEGLVQARDERGCLESVESEVPLGIPGTPGHALFFLLLWLPPWVGNTLPLSHQLSVFSRLPGSWQLKAIVLLVDPL